MNEFEKRYNELFPPATLASMHNEITAFLADVGDWLDDTAVIVLRYQQTIIQRSLYDAIGDLAFDVIHKWAEAEAPDSTIQMPAFYQAIYSAPTMADMIASSSQWMADAEDVISSEIESEIANQINAIITALIKITSFGQMRAAAIDAGADEITLGRLFEIRRQQKTEAAK